MDDSDSLSSFFASPYFSSKHSSYFQVYDFLFSSYKQKEITFLEIGVYGGGSLFMWRNFFGKKARIIGIDLNPDAKKFEKYGFEILIGSQKDEKFLEDVKKKVGKIDIVLDDGGHTYEQQIITAVSLLENIKDNGMLVVEDTHTSYMEGYGPVEYSFVNYVKELIDKINHRFYLLNQKYSDNRIWSIEIFESIVALKINNKALQTVSQKIENSRKIDGKLQDFRHVDKTKVDILKYFKKTQADTFSK
jgi:hypothetical protein